MNEPAAAPAPTPARLPPGLVNAYVFAVFNALSFQMVLSNPMILYAKSLGATATALGLIAGMVYLLNIFQIPAARHVDRVGHKRFVLAGWSTRVVFIFLMALVPLSAGFLTAQTRLVLMVFMLFGFNLSRGISVCGWLPWITAIIPGPMRGRYLAREAACVNSASFVAFLLAAGVLGTAPTGWRFSLLFLFSGVAGAVSLGFMKRIPEGTPPPAARSWSGEPVPWRAIAAYPPFRKLLRMNVAMSLAAGGVTPFVTAFLKGRLNLPESEVMGITAVSFLGGLSSLWLLGRRLDEYGSKPALVLSHGVWLLIMAGLTLVSTGVVPPRLGVLALLQFLMGLCLASVQMANIRLVMGTIPEMGRSHFFALQSVVSNVAFGLSPIAWGLAIDGAGSLELWWHGLFLDRYGLYFMGAFVAFAVSLVLCHSLVEPASLSTEAMLRDILTRSRLRAWLRLWPRA
ncbi:MAG: MFS transporter [Verrucomicrobia bacterium]|nr:MFS transporter [Verrucomicrobiota bacterium]